MSQIITLDNKDIYNKINSGKLINKYCFVNNNLAEVENFDLYFTGQAKERSFTVGIEQTLRSLDGNRGLITDASFEQDTILMKSLASFQIGVSQNITCVISGITNEYCGLEKLKSNSKNLNPTELMELIKFFNRKKEKIKLSSQPETIVFETKELGRKILDTLLIYSENESSFIIPKLVIYALAKTSSIIQANGGTFEDDIADVSVG